MIDLHPEAKSAMIRHLVEGLPKINVENGKFVQPFGSFLATYFADQALPKGIRSEAETFVDELPFVEFASDYIRRELYERGEYAKEADSKPLFEVGIFDECKNLANELIEAFCSLPWEFRIALPFHDRLFPSEMFSESEHAVGLNLKISTPNLFSEAEFPLDHPNPDRSARADGRGLLRVGKPEWARDMPHFIANSFGFIPIYGGGNVMGNVQFSLEAFLGLGLAIRIFSYDYQHDNQYPSAGWVVHRRIEGGWEFWTRFDLEEDAKDVLRHLRSFRFNEKYAVERRQPWLVSALGMADRVTRHTNARPLLLASKWLFDSYKKSEPALAYVRLMTVLEILLGGDFDYSKSSLSEIMANRLAYLTGSNFDNRSSILKEFKEIYALRSRIIHRGKHRLSSEERSMMARLRKHCENAIFAEAKALLG